HGINKQADLTVRQGRGEIWASQAQTGGGKGSLLPLSHAPSPASPSPDSILRLQQPAPPPPPSSPPPPPSFALLPLPRASRCSAPQKTTPPPRQPPRSTPGAAVQRPRRPSRSPVYSPFPPPSTTTPVGPPCRVASPRPPTARAQPLTKKNPPQETPHAPEPWELRERGGGGDGGGGGKRARIGCLSPKPLCGLATEGGEGVSAHLALKAECVRCGGGRRGPGFGLLASRMEGGSVSNVEVCNLAYTGRLEELKERLSANRSLAERADQDNRTALHWACSAGHADIVDFLLSLGVHVNDKDDAGWSPLHIAASAGRDEIVKTLIRKGAQVNAVNQNGCTPLHYAASKNRQEIALMLLENCANPDAKDHLASTPLHRAASKGNLKMIQILLKYKASANLQDSEGNTALHLACDEERADEAKLLVSHGASIYIENKEDKTPLQVAKGGLGSILRRLVEG
uniref:26S proteasome non-ATPase regulatory subunit 10 n=2 Tax=Podarcis muralis TaxID=64176 RepID=A0A670K1E1_PODMU